MTTSLNEDMKWLMRNTRTQYEIFDDLKYLPKRDIRRTITMDPRGDQTGVGKTLVLFIPSWIVETEVVHAVDVTGLGKTDTALRFASQYALYADHTDGHRPILSTISNGAVFSQWVEKIFQDYQDLEQVMTISSALFRLHSLHALSEL